MILLPNMREIDVADLILVVKIDQQAAIADGDISHTAWLLRGDCFFYRGIKLLLDRRAKADNLGYDVS